MTFCTAINCIDGRVQKPVFEYLTKRFGVEYVDMVNHPGVNLLLAEQTDTQAIQNILSAVTISVEKHASTAIAVAGHFDCGANHADKDTQNAQTAQAVEFLKQKFPAVQIIGLWVDENWNVSEVC